MSYKLHGLRNTSEYNVYYHMRARCLNPNNKDYHHYGGRGIKVCDRWLDSVVSFYQDMGERPSLKHSIDRINNNGNYEPSNCRWATQTEQAANQRLRKDNSSGVRNVSWHKELSKWQADFRPKKDSKAKRRYLGVFDSVKEAAKAINDAELASIK